MLGRWLKEARHEAGLSQVEVARRSGVDRSYLSDLERDRQSPSVNVLVRVCKAIGVSPAKIFAKWEREEKLNQKPRKAE